MKLVDEFEYKTHNETQIKIFYVWLNSTKPGI